MRATTLALWASTTLLASGIVAPATAAETFTQLGQGLHDRATTAVEVHGALRLRGEALNNLDLDRGPTPSGRMFFPVPLSDPTAAMLTHADMRLRTDLSIFAPRGGLAIHMRLDVMDGTGLGASPDGAPLGATGQAPESAQIRLRRVWAETVTPFGVLAAGRMGSHWGLGILTHGGDGMESDTGDAADRIAFVTPIAGLIWALAYDFSATGPQVARTAPGRTIDLDPRDDVRTITFAVLRFADETTFARRARAGRTTLDAGLWLSRRTQELDVPASWLPNVDPSQSASGALTSASVVPRNFSALAGDLWLRWRGARFRVEVEAAVLSGTVEQGTLLPGALYRDPVESLQIGAALQTDFGDPKQGFGGGLDAGYASGDPAPGFGAAQPVGAGYPQPGELDGPQASPPADTRIDNFRFHSGYRVDRILFRELLGRVTDAIYLRPHVHHRVADFGAGTLQLDLAAVAAWAVEAQSTPGGTRPLGVEIDPTIRYESRDGFIAALQGAWLLPLSGLDNPAAGLQAKSAWLARLTLQYTF